MKRILLAAAALAMLAGTPALAQYGGGYGGGGGGGYGGGYGGGRGYSDDDDDDRRRRRWERRREREESGYGGGYGRPRFGNVCVTSRGNCPTQPAPISSGCGCSIPGFGLKRGAVLAGG